jgi:hypothetical protein
MDIPRRKAISTVATTSLLGLAGCSQSLPGGGVATGSEPVGVRTLGYNAQNVDNVELLGEVTGVGDADELFATVQRSTDSYDEWSPTFEENPYQFEGIDEPREFTRKMPGTIDGGVEYQYRAVIVADGEPTYGEMKMFNLHDLGLDVPKVEFSTPSMDEGSTTLELTAENVSDIQTGSVGCGVEWYDEDNVYLGSSYSNLYTLRPGETGVITVNTNGDDVRVSDIAEYEHRTEYSPVYRPAEGVEVIETELREGEITVTAEKTQSNNRGNIDAVARFFDADGRVIDDVIERVNTSSVPVGQWRFEIGVSGDIIDEGGFEVILSQG